MKSLKTRSSWISQAGPKPNSNVLMIRGEDTGKREGQVKREAAIRVTLPQAKKTLDLARAGRGKRIFP